MFGVIFKDKYNDKGWVLEDTETYYLYSTLFKYDCQLKLGIFEYNTVYISGEMLVELHNRIHSTLGDLIATCYESPDHKRHSKYPGNYQKVIFESKVYTVDYRLSRLGHLIFAINTSVKSIL